MTQTKCNWIFTKRKTIRSMNAEDLYSIVALCRNVPRIRSQQTSIYNCIHWCITLTKTKMTLLIIVLWYFYPISCPVLLCNAYYHNTWNITHRVLTYTNQGVIFTNLRTEFKIQFLRNKFSEIKKSVTILLILCVITINQ